MQLEGQLTEASLSDAPNQTRPETHDGAPRLQSLPKLAVRSLAALVALLAGVLRDRSRPTLLTTEVPEPHVDHPIVDATGIDGGWNFVMGWTPKGQLANTLAQNANQAPEAPAADPGGITLFEAVEKELGLKLVKQKRSIPVIVVDHVSEKPIE